MASKGDLATDRPQAGAVLFAKDHAALARFYVEAMALTQFAQGDDHIVLACRGFRLVVHRIPPAIAQGITVDVPPRRRESGAVKLAFAVDSLERARQRVAALGGIVDPPDTEWSDDETTTCKGHDPEGNTFNVFAYR